MGDRLAGYRVLLTRAETDAGLQKQLLEEAGIRFIHIPVLAREVADAGMKLNLQKLESLLPTVQKVIFISAHAVGYAGRWLDTEAGRLPADVSYFAVGPATAKAVQGRGWTAALPPDGDWSARGLLTLPALQSVQEQNILIVRGQGGGELLGRELQRRGAAVHYAEVYRRRAARENTEKLCQLLVQQPPNAILLQSLQSYHFLRQLAGNYIGELNRIPLVVAADSITQQAMQSDASYIITAADATDKALVDALQFVRRLN